MRPATLGSGVPIAPAAPLDARQVRWLVGHALRAPSSHNTQPWRFRPGGEGIDVSADWSRWLGPVDLDGREIRASVGAAVQNLVVAARWLGCEAAVTIGDALRGRVTVALAPGRRPRREALFAPLMARRTDRAAFDGAPLGA